MPSDIELLTQLTQANTQKLDQLLRDKVDMQYYRDRHEELERRVGVLETNVQKIDDTIGHLHSTSMDRLHEMFAQATAKVTEDNKKLQEQISDLRTSIYRTIVMSFVVPVVIAIVVAAVSRLIWH